MDGKIDAFDEFNKVLETLPLELQLDAIRREWTFYCDFAMELHKRQPDKCFPFLRTITEMLVGAVGYDKVAKALLD